MRKYLLASIAILFILTGCSKNSQTPSNSSPVSSLKLNKSSLSLFIGYADTLQVIGQSSSDVTWTTSNDSVATVTNGQIFAVSKGTVTITAKIAGESGTASCTVTITDMSDVIDAGNGFVLLNDSTEEVLAGIGNSSSYDITINRVAIYSTTNVLISDHTLSADSTIIIPAHTTTISKNYNIGTGNLYIYEPKDKKGVVLWKSVDYFYYNNKYYNVTVVNGNIDHFTAL